jgi:hypothetical protein
MTARDPRDRLQELRLTSERIASNLLELEGDETVAMLDAAELRGVTAERWGDARVRLAGLFASHTALKDLVEQSTRVLGRSWVHTADRMKELQAMLEGPSICVSDTTLSLPDRGLLAESRRIVRRTPDQLVADMVHEYEAVRSVVVGVCRVWEMVIPRLRAERERELRLDAIVAQFGVERPDLAAAGAALRSLSDLALSDPLALDAARVDDVAAEIDTIEVELAELRSLETQWPDRVAEARELLSRASRATDACAEAVAHVNSRIALHEAITPNALPSHLVVSLDEAVALGGDDRLSGGAALLAWRQAIGTCIDNADALTVQCRRLIDERDELRARLDVYAAKADRLRMLEAADVVDAFERARTALYTAPTDLRRAGELVAAYQRLLMERSAT